MPRRICRASVLWILGLCFCLVDCGGGGGGGGSTPPAGTAPSNLSYAQEAITALVGQPIPPDNPIVTGTPTQYLISPPLPSGMVQNASTGIISGTPTAVVVHTSYVVTASNAFGSTTAPLEITVSASQAPPSALAYPNTPIVATLGLPLAPDTPTVTGAVSSYSVSPALPAGLDLDPSTGVLSGTPTAAASQATYTVTAANDAGSTSVALVITVNATLAPPSHLAYAVSTVTALAGQALSPDPPTVSGTVTSFTVTPPLPSGLSLDGATGVISGTPTTAQPAASYTVSASNSAGSATAVLQITVTQPPPGSFTYALATIAGTVGHPIPADAPSVSGGVSSFSITPALPAGLSLDATSGVISGTPTAIAPQVSYTVTASNAGGSVTATLLISVAATPPANLVYPVTSLLATVGAAITADTPTVSGIVSTFASSPPLPVGLSLDATSGSISGTPSAPSPQATYNITASNGAGSTTTTVQITVAIAAPGNLAYPVTAIIATSGAAIPPDTPTFTGTATSFSIAPALPVGLAFNSSTGSISGTPSAVSTQAAYTVTAANASGSTTTSIQVTVNPALPGNLAYPAPSLIGTVGAPIPADTPTYTGTVSAFSITPALPPGLAFSAATGGISGTPTAASVQTVYTVTASNAGGSTATTVLVTVNIAAPSNLVYPVTTIVATDGAAISLDTPTLTGIVTSFAVSPALPPGLLLNASTGAISGTPTGTSAQASYVVTASNTTGSTTATVQVTVNVATPGNLVYSGITANVGTAITPVTPTYTGFSPVFTAPSLPAGLSINASTGTVSGTPTTASALANYPVTATNASGSASGTVAIAVSLGAPSGLAYPITNIVATSGVPFPADKPTYSGIATSFSISAPLPAGLTFSTTDGSISGTPSAVAASTPYTVTATNSSGLSSNAAPVQVVVNAALAAPASLSYPVSTLVAAVGTAIAPDTPSVTGTVGPSPIVPYAISPSLPAGLSFNSTTGAITGTPTGTSVLTAYTVTATNAAGSTTATIHITVNVAAPTSLTYPVTNLIATVGTLISSDVPTVTGGPTFTISPALPAGLGLNFTTGGISGTPTVATAQATYTVTATNVSGTTTAQVQITVKPAAPTGLSYPVTSITAVSGTAIATDTPTVTGTVTSWSISPALPAGLAISGSTGAISGTPTAAKVQTSYVVTASNSTGSSTTTVQLTVNVAAPSNLVYPVSSIQGTIGTAISTDTPTVTGAVTSYAVSPALPAGLGLNGATGAISGTPTAAASLASYTVTAANATGSTTASVQITIKIPAPSNLAYSVMTLTGVVGTAIANDSPSVLGTVVSYAVNPALPPGLNLNTTSGVISGTPTATASQAAYVVTATNSTGSTSATLRISINPSAPSNLSYPVSALALFVNQAMTADVPTVTGAVTAFTISPALPAGLTLSSATGTLSGTPAAASAQTSYTVTASNASGSTTAAVTLSVANAGSLALTITGLPTGVNGDVIVTGPGNYTNTLTATQTLSGLASGTYTVTAYPVIFGTPSTTYSPWQAVQTVSVATGTSTATVLYPLPVVTVNLPDLSSPGNTVPMVFLLIPGGSYLMGSSDPLDNPASEEVSNGLPPAEPTHTVSSVTAFYLSKYPVTQGQWKAIMNANPAWFSVAGGGSATDNFNRPVERVNWADIRVTTTSPAYTCFLDALNARMPGYAFSLPSEAQYEYVLRAGTTTAYFFGIDSTNLSTYAWDYRNTNSTQPVGQLAANPWGLFDISGNVWEWCEDDWHEGYGGAPADGSAWVDASRGAFRVLRGGSWVYLPQVSVFRSGYRFYSSLTTRNDDFGFRLVIPVPRTN